MSMNGELPRIVKEAIAACLKVLRAGQSSSGTDRSTKKFQSPVPVPVLAPIHPTSECCVSVFVFYIFFCFSVLNYFFLLINIFKQFLMNLALYLSVRLSKRVSY